MDKKLKFILVFLGSGAIMFLIFYLYPAEIFDAEIIGRDGGVIVQEVSMKSLLGQGDLPSNFNEDNVAEVKGKVSGWLIFVIITIGMPLMFAYRSLVQKTPKEKEE